MKKFGAICLACCLLAALLLPVSSSAAIEESEDKSLLQGCHTIDSQVPLLGSMPYTDNAKSIILYECKTDTLMYAYNPDLQMYPSSFVKIMTGYIAAEEANLADMVTVRQDVLDTIPEGSAASELQPGEIMSLENLMYCMLVDSANDAAAVIADYVGGTQAAFVEKMNAYAQELGCTNTVFMNAHGLHHEQQVTTARDTAKILAAAMQNEAFATIFNTAFYDVPATNKSRIRYLETINHLINYREYADYYDTRVTGGRTAITDDGYRCVAAASEAEGLKMISVVMGTHSTFEEETRIIKIIGGFLETSALLDMGYAGYKEVQIAYDGRVVKQQAVTNGNSNVVLGTKEALSTILPSGIDDDDLIYRYNDIPGAFEAPVAKGELMSEVEIWYGSVCLGHLELYAMNDVEPIVQSQVQTAPETPVKPSGKTGKVILWVALGVVAVVALAVISLLVVRRVRLAHARRRSKQYRRSRRRSR